MLKKILLIVVILSISGCTSIPGWKVEMAVRKCEDHGGVNSMSQIINSSTVASSAICNDGTKVLIGLGK